MNPTFNHRAFYSTVTPPSECHNQYLESCHHPRKRILHGYQETTPSIWYGTAHDPRIVDRTPAYKPPMMHDLPAPETDYVFKGSVFESHFPGSGYEVSSVHQSHKYDSALRF
jgi:hypothetical protein